MERFKMTDMGDVSLVICVQVSRDRQNKTPTISQENYTKSNLETFGMTNCKLPVLQATDGSSPSNNRRTRGRDATVPSHYGIGDLPRSNHKVRHHVQHLPTRSCYVQAFEDAHGRGQAPAEIPGCNYRFHHGLQERRIQTYSLLRLQLGNNLDNRNSTSF